MDIKSGEGGGAQRRLRLGLATVAAMMLVTVFATAAGEVPVLAGTVAMLALAAVGGATYARAVSRFSRGVSDDGFAAAQVVALGGIIAALSASGGGAAPAVPLLLPVVLLFGALRLPAAKLVVLAGILLVMQGTALFHLIDAGGRLPLAAAWSQLGALALVFAWLIAASGAVRRLRARLAETLGALHDAGVDAGERASRDALTGAYHHRHLIEALEREIARAERLGKPLSVARADLDRLRAINDSYGHIAGDVALRRFTAAAGAALRDVDLLGRYGGKEFLILMPDTDLKGAVIAAERVRAAVGREPVPEVDGRKFLSCTLGVAEHRRGENTRLLIARAEAGLSYAKAAGRDRVVTLDGAGRPVLAGNS